MMMTISIFISSVQKEFAEERAALRDYLRGDPLMRRFFDVFLFEEVPASDRRPDHIYLQEVERCDIYVGLFGSEYGPQDADGLSPTELEFNLATERHKHRLIFVKGTDGDRHPKMQALIGRASAGLIRRRFATTAELMSNLYSALVEYLEHKQLIASGPFDAAPCRGASFDDLNPDSMAAFIRKAREARQFPLTDDTLHPELLEHLNLMDLNDWHPTNAAVLLFGREPQRHLPTSEVKCAHFHGTEVAKPIPSYQVYKGTVFEMVDKAVDFVLSSIALTVGTRAAGQEVPVQYEIPREVVSEAIVNAVAHRDYTSNGSVQVMLFKDRLEVWNPGRLPPSLTVEELRGAHGSVPANPLLAEPMYLARYIERMGTGTRDMIRRCVEADLPEPQFEVSDGFRVSIPRPAAEVPPKQGKPGAAEDQVRTKPGPSRDQAGVLRKCLQPSSIKELMATAGRTNRTKFRDQVLNPLLEAGWVEMTLPDKPTSPKQQYRLTAAGKDALTAKEKGGGAP